jgi:hypothetical protein
MADFVQSSETKRSVRKLTSPIEDVTAFDTLVQTIISTNPFNCAEYMSAGETHPPVEKTKEAYTLRFVYQDTDAKPVGTGNHKFTSLPGYTAGIAALSGATAVSTAHGGTAVHDADEDSYSVTLKCHDPNGELYNLVLSRTQLNLTSYEDDAILARVEAWADSVPELV